LHSNLIWVAVQSRPEYFLVALSGKSPLEARPVPCPIRGAYRDRHERWTWDAMDAVSPTDE
jgi:hypothetical protein